MFSPLNSILLFGLVAVRSVSGEAGAPCNYNEQSGWCVTVDANGHNFPDCRDKGGFFMDGLCSQGVPPLAKTAKSSSTNAVSLLAATPPVAATMGLAYLQALTVTVASTKMTRIKQKIVIK
jgi:hypothetical protein